MEELGEDEAKSIANDWFRRLERSILAQATGNHADESDRHFHYQDSVSGGLSHDASAVESEDIANRKKADRLSDEEDVLRRRDNLYRPTPTREGLQSNIPNNFKTLTDSERVLASASSGTPRVDLDLLRQKRLEHFRALNQASSSSTSHIKEQNLPSVDSESQLSLSEEPSDSSDQTDRAMLQCKTNFSPTLGSPRFDESVWTARANLTTRNNIVTEDEDDDLRLELWGLRGAVETGQLDINSYLGSFPKLKSKPDNAVGKPFSTVQHHCGDYASSLEDSDTNRNRTKFSHDIGDIPEVKSCHGNFSDDFFMPNIPRTLGLQYSEKSSEVRKESLPGNSGNHSHQSGVRFCHTANNNGNNQQDNSSYPSPQIYGALYNGFETSDSEGSVRSFKLRNGRQEQLPVKSAEKIPQSCRGKEKILSELTEFLDSERKEKKSRNSERKSFSPSSSPDLLVGSKDPSADSPGEVSQGQPLGNHTSNESPDNPIHHNLQPYRDFSQGLSPELLKEKQQHSLANEESSLPRKMAKVCPSCAEINSQAANWCIECGSALIKTKPTALSCEQQKEYETQCREAELLISEALNGRKHDMNEKKPHLIAKNGDNGAGSKSLEEEIFGLIKEVDCNMDLKDDVYDSNQVCSYKRRWHKSSLAWNTFEPRELSKPPSLNISKNKQSQIQDESDIRKSRSSSDLTGDEGERKSGKRNGHRNKSSRRRTTSATYHSDDAHTRKSSHRGPGKERPQSAVLHSASHKGTGQRKRPVSAKPRSSYSMGSKASDGTEINLSWTEDTKIKEDNNDVCTSPSKCAVSVVPPLDLNDIDSYDRILTLIRSQREPVPYLYLPDEILLKIFSSLSHHDLVCCALVCWQFYRIAMDETLWKIIVLRKKEIKSDNWLIDIGRRKPTSVTMSQCRGNCVSAEGLRTMFRSCSDTLEEVDFSGCSGGELIGESLLLHISARCTNVISVDVSWTNVSDNGVQALAENVIRLECLCLNGCQAITDKSLKCVSNKHGTSLRIFEVFGCFNITPGGIHMLGKQCKHLQTLNLGQCHKMTDSALGSLVSHLPELENLDLRGCKQARDSAVKKIVHYCPLLTCLVLANCPLITDVSLAEIATNLPGIKSLDICGCSNISDAGVRALARSCSKMELLDLSSTGNAVTHKSVTSLANYCHQTLHTLKLSFCADITDQTVLHLAKQCRKFKRTPSIWMQASS